MSIPIAALTLEQVEVVCRRACILLECNRGSTAQDTLTSLGAAAAALSAEGCVPACTPAILQAGALLWDLLVLAQEPYTPAPAVEHLQALCTAAEDAAAHLRKCHGALMSSVSVTPPPPTVDGHLVAARDAAFAAAQATSSALSHALLEADMDAISAFGQTAIDKHTALLRRVSEWTAVDVGKMDAPCPSSNDTASDSTETSALLGMALTTLDSFASDIGNAVCRLTALAPVTIASLGSKDTKPTRAALETMREATHNLFLATGDSTLSHHLAHEAPWHTACSVLAARNDALNAQSNALGGLQTIAAQLQKDTAAWTAAFEEREAKVKTLKASQAAFSLARRALRQAIADATPVDGGESSSDEDTAAAAAALNSGTADALRVAKRASGRASVARDGDAHDLFTSALAYYPETLVTQRKRLLPGGFPAVVSQRSLEDYEDIEILERAGASRHTLLQATFDGELCVLKVVPISTSQSVVREAGILKQVNHPNIIKLLAVFVENHNAYLHMAYARQGDLNHFLTTEVALATAATEATPALAAAALAPRQLQRLARQLCEAVAYLAERSIVHCDIKPANVFVDGNRDNDSLCAILGDFDVSHTATGRTTSLTRAMKGAVTHYTPGFAPPEVLHAPEEQPPSVSPAIDVYGLGCVVFTLHMFPRTLPEPKDAQDDVASDTALFLPAPRPQAATPAVAAWAASVPRELVQSATRAEPRSRASARSLLHTRYMLDASGSFVHVAIQRPAYWLYQSQSGSWLVEEPEETRMAVERLFNATAEPSGHGVGRDSHTTPFQRFRVKCVQRLEHPVLWSAYAAQRRHLADTLVAEGYSTSSDIRPLATEDGGFVFPLEGGSLEDSAAEVFLFHGSSKPESIANSGFDVKYAFAGAGAGAMFGHGVYFAESASKADQYVGRDGASTLTMVVARVLLGRTVKVTAPRNRSVFLPEVPDKSSDNVPAYYDSLVADMRPQGMRFREIVVGDGTRAYPELFVEYERV